ncbi:hypothetical protein EJB05_49243, partial [Eragrostis curvula]
MEKASSSWRRLLLDGEGLFVIEKASLHMEKDSSSWRRLLFASLRMEKTSSSWRRLLP